MNLFSAKNFPYRGAVFDLDGTLLNSTWIWRQIDIDFLSERGFAVPDDYVDAIAPMGFREVAVYTIQRFGLHETPEAVVDIWNQMAMAHYRDDVTLKPGAKDYLLALKKRGVQLGIATLSHPSLFEPTLRREGVWELFDAIALSSEVSRGKDAPDLYLLAAQKLDVAPGCCAAFEDVPTAMRGASLAGMAVCGVIDPHSDTSMVLHQGLCRSLIQNFKELL